MGMAKRAFVIKEGYPPFWRHRRRVTLLFPVIPWGVLNRENLERRVTLLFPRLKKPGPVPPIGGRWKGGLPSFLLGTGGEFLGYPPVPIRVHQADAPPMIAIRME
jgi:hypothetical protein